MCFDFPLHVFVQALWVPDSRALSPAAEKPSKKGTQHSWRKVKWASDVTNESSSIYRVRKKSALVWRFTFFRLQGNHITNFMLIFRNICLINYLSSPRNKILLHALSYAGNRAVFCVMGIPQEWQISICFCFWVCNLVPSWAILILKGILQVCDIG